MKNITVIKFGGSLSKNPAAIKKFLGELAALAKKEPVVLVHGGGPEINSWLSRVGIESKFVNGLRFTDGPTLEVVEMVLSGKVNKSFTGELNRRGVRAVGLSGRDGGMLTCRRLPKLGFVGDPVKVDTKLIETLLKGGFLPVVSSLGTDARGQVLNLNADSVAMALAQKLTARRLVLLTDVPGVLDGAKKTIPVIRLSEIKGLLQNGIVTGGMIPKIKACAGSVECGITEVWVADGSKGLKKLTGTVIKK